MKTNLIRFTTSDGLRLDGILYAPNKKTNKCVIHVHGTSSDFYRTKYVDTFAPKFTKSGWALLTFNNRGSGSNYKFYKENEKGEITERVKIGSTDEIFEDCEIDIQAAIDFAKTKGFDELVLQGHSYGCNKVIWYAINNKTVGKIILLAPCDVMSVPNNRKAKNPANIDMFRYRDKVAPASLTKIKHDILIEIGACDEYIIQKDKKECIDYLTKTFKSSKVTGHIAADTNHNYDGKYAETANNIVTWLNN